MYSDVCIAQRLRFVTIQDEQEKRQLSSFDTLNEASTFTLTFALISQAFFTQHYTCTYMDISCRVVYLILQSILFSRLSPLFHQASPHESTIHGSKWQGSLLFIKSLMICLYILRNPIHSNIPTSSLTTTFNLHIFRDVIRLNQTLSFQKYATHFFEN